MAEDEFESDHESSDEIDSQDPEIDPGASDGEEADKAAGFRMPAGFAQSLLPDVNDIVARIVAPWRKQMQEQMRSMLPDVDALARGALAPINERLREQMASAIDIPAFSVRAIDLPELRGAMLGPATEGLLKQIAEQHAKMMEGFRASLGPLFDPEALRGINRALLPPNLREHADDIRAHEVHVFVEQERVAARAMITERS